ncbi:hypothetical protein N7454_001512 [Penicillium verhagenii]|nr:hypothetical protein N7454_001512 [Penicillium verhagenii]
MDRIPVETLQQISLYLKGPRHGPHTDLSSLSRACRGFYSAALPILYNTLTIKFWDMKSLQAAVSEVLETPRGNNFKKYARRLYIICLEERDLPRKLPINQLSEREPATMNSFLEYWLTNRMMSRCGKIAKNRSWAPVESLISSLHRLKQFDFITSSEFTRGLERALSRHHPNCIINLGTVGQAVGLSVLDATVREEINPDKEAWQGCEFNVQTLQRPCLGILTVPLIRILHRSGSEEDLDEMLSFLVTATGPKHLILKGQIVVPTWVMTRLKEEWQRLIDARTPTQASQLESISLLGLEQNEDILFKLVKAGHLSNLRSLSIGGVRNPVKLIEIAGLFTNLERLFMQANRPWTDFDLDHDNMIQAIRAFRPLKYLALGGLRRVDNLYRILAIHGPSLKGLILRPLFNRISFVKLEASNVIQMAKICVNLEELRIQIRRSSGKQEECEAYKALGRFRRLRSLILDLYCDTRKQPPMHNTEMEDLSVLREMFINAAIDEKLCLSIWDMINTNAPCPIHYLRIVPIGNSPIGSTTIRYLLAGFMRSFLVTRYNFQNPGSASVEEVEQTAQEAMRALKPVDYFLPERIERLLHDIWPSVPEESDWWSCWTSLPLKPDKI